MFSASRLLRTLAQSSGENDQIDYKAGFDTESKQEWCEILKDIIAMANSGGGVIVVGIADDGTFLDAGVSDLLEVDPALITDKISSYTGTQFSSFEIRQIEHNGNLVAGLFIGPAESPIVFAKPGTYPVVGEKQSQKTAFSQGTVYFRHGAKSEPGTTEDLRKFIERKIEQVGRLWRRNIRRVVTAPAGHDVKVVPLNMKMVPDDDAQEVRLVNDDTAPATRFMNPDETHPFRLKELIPELRRRLDGKVKLTSHDIQCVRRVHGTDNDPNFTYVPKFASRQYSTAFAEWMAEEYRKDPQFFDKAYDENARIQALARSNKKPR